MAATSWSVSDHTANITLSNANLTMTFAQFGQLGGRSTDSFASGKYYWEVTFPNGSGSTTGSGVANAGATLTTFGAAGQALVDTAGNVRINGTAVITIPNITAGGFACIALDIGASLIWFRNGAAGNWNNNATYNPATGTGGQSISAITGPFLAYGGDNNANGQSITANFGATAFAGVVPAGFTPGLGTGLGGTTPNAVRVMVMA